MQPDERYRGLQLTPRTVHPRFVVFVDEFTHFVCACDFKNYQ
jgi:hypothetical protein